MLDHLPQLNRILTQIASGDQLGNKQLEHNLNPKLIKNSVIIFSNQIFGEFKTVLKRFINVEYIDHSLDINTVNNSKQDMNSHSFQNKSSKQSNADVSSNEQTINLNEITSLVQFAINADANSEIFHIRLI